MSSKRPETRELGVSWIRDRLLDYPSERLTPYKLGTIFREADQGNIFRQMELFEEMEQKDTHLISIMQTRKLSVSGLEWEVTAASQSTQDQEIAADVKEMIEGLENFDEALHHLMDAAGKGFSVLEIMWELGNKWTIVELKEKLQRRFTYFNMNFQEDILPLPRVLTPEQPVYGEELPSYKFVVHTYKAKCGTVPRSALFRPIAWMYLFKNYSIKDWITFLEAYGMPMRIGKYDPATSKEDKDALIKAVTMLGSDAAAVISNKTAIEIVESVKGTQNADAFKAFADYANEEMAKAILGQTLTSGTGSKGGGHSLALGKVHDQVRSDIKKADAKALSRTVKNQIIAGYVGYNYGFDKPLPNFKLMADDPKDQVETVKVDGQLQKMGWPITKKYISETYGRPEPEAGDEVLVPIDGGADPAGLDEGGDAGALKQALKKKSLMLSRKK